MSLANWLRWGLGICLLVHLLPLPLHADNGWNGHILSLYWENDATAGSDRHYTQGSGLSYLTADDASPPWMETFSDVLPSLGFEVQALKTGFALAQEIYTPQDLRSFALVADDRPYAGWLFGTISLQRRGPGYRSWPTRETVRLDLGVIGPESQAEDTQKTWHGIAPKGWPHQLRFEPGFVAGYQRQVLFPFRSESKHWGIDLIPYVAADLGTVSTLARIGSTARFGYNIPRDFATEPEDGTLRYGIYLSTGLDGRYVARNIFLDGNTFRSSHHVDKIPWVGACRVGLTLVLKRVEVMVAHTFLSREFEHQKSTDSYGTATLTYKF